MIVNSPSIWIEKKLGCFRHKIFSPIHVSIYKPSLAPKQGWSTAAFQSQEQFPMPPKMHPDPLPIVMDQTPIEGISIGRQDMQIEDTL